MTTHKNIYLYGILISDISFFQMQTPCRSHTRKNNFICPFETSPSLCPHAKRKRKTNANPTLSLSIPSMETTCLKSWHCHAVTAYSLSVAVTPPTHPGHPAGTPSPRRQWANSSWNLQPLYPLTPLDRLGIFIFIISQYWHPFWAIKCTWTVWNQSYPGIKP